MVRISDNLSVQYKGKSEGFRAWRLLSLESWIWPRGNFFQELHSAAFPRLFGGDQDMQ